MSDKVEQVKSNLAETRKQIAKKYRRSHDERVRREHEIDETLCTPLLTNDNSQLVVKSGCGENDNFEEIDIDTNPNSPENNIVAIGTSIDGEGKKEHASGKNAARGKKDEIALKFKAERAKLNTNAKTKKNTVPITPSWLEPTSSSGDNVIEKDYESALNKES